MTLILGLALGALTGWLASTLMKTRRPHGAKVDSLIGMIGALIGIYLLEFFDLGDGFGWAVSLGVTLAGAVGLLSLMKPVRK